MSRKKRVDAIDIHMLNILQQDGRIASSELAKQIGLSEGPTNIRLRNLIKRAVVRIAAHINLEMLGYRYQVIVLVKLVPGKESWFLSKLRENLSIQFAFEVKVHEVGLDTGTKLLVGVVTKSKELFIGTLQKIAIHNNILISLELFEIKGKIVDSPFIQLSVDDQI